MLLESLKQLGAIYFVNVTDLYQSAHVLLQHLTCTFSCSASFLCRRTNPGEVLKLGVSFLFIPVGKRLILRCVCRVHELCTPSLLFCLFGTNYEPALRIMRLFLEFSCSKAQQMCHSVCVCLSSQGRPATTHSRDQVHDGTIEVPTLIDACLLFSCLYLCLVGFNHDFSAECRSTSADCRLTPHAMSIVLQALSHACAVLGAEVWSTSVLHVFSY
jgi:hypothetical protein